MFADFPALQNVQTATGVGLRSSTQCCRRRRNKRGSTSPPTIGELVGHHELLLEVDRHFADLAGELTALAVVLLRHSGFHVDTDTG